jgi:hypothetical protein
VFGVRHPGPSLETRVPFSIDTRSEEAACGARDCPMKNIKDFLIEADGISEYLDVVRPQKHYV